MTDGLTFPIDLHVYAAIERLLIQQHTPSPLLADFSEDQKKNFVRAAKLDTWRMQNCPLDKGTLGRGTWGLVS